MQFIRSVTLLILALLLLSTRGPASTNPDKPVHYEFEENKGQFHPNVLFRCRLPNGFLYLEQQGITYLLENQDDIERLMHVLHEHEMPGPKPKITLHGHAVKLNFLSSAPNALIKGVDQLPYYFNYFLSNDRSDWQQGVRLYRGVYYHNIYPNIDLEFYVTDQGQLKYDWIIKEDGNAGQIALSIEGSTGLGIDHEQLHINTSCGTLIESQPVVQIENEQHLGQFSLTGDVLSYNGFDELQPPYRIDPALIFSTYSGSRGDNFGFTATYDSRGNLYAGGITNGAQGNYPVTSGAVQQAYGGGGTGLPAAGLPCDITISKYDSSGSKLLWATYLGGVNNEYPHSLVVNQNDDLYVFGTSYSDDYPTSLQGYDTSFNGLADIIVTKISADGKTLIGSTFVGGSQTDGLNSNGTLRYNYADDFRGDIIPDEIQDIFIATCTRSDDFPMVDAVDSKYQNQEGCLLQFDSDLTELKWSTFLGGRSHDALYSVKVDNDSMVYVGGGTASNDIPTADTSYVTDYLGNTDGYVIALDRKNHKLKRATYYGTEEYDQVYFIDLNHEGGLFVNGQTTGNIKPSNPSIYGEANRGQFIAKLDTALIQLEWETSFGSRPNEINVSPSAFLVDNCEHIYASGWGSNVDPNLNPGSTLGMETSPNAVQKTTDGNDFYLLVLDKNAESLLYATYFGGDTTDDHVDGGTSRFDKKGVVYQSVCASCPDPGVPGHQDFPVTSNAAFTSNLSPRCSNASFKIDLQIKSDVDAYFIPSPLIGCQPLEVNFDNRSDIAQRFIWDFGDGTLDSTTLQPSHTYSEPGIYEIKLTVIDSNTCNISDVFTRKIEVVGTSNAGFTYEIDPCTFEANFKSTEEALTYDWIIEDTVINTEKFDYQFPPGSNTMVRLIANKGTLCADSVEQLISTQDTVTRDIFIPNVFTPNGDGLNDNYCVTGLLDGCDEMILTIYNRWGERVFKTDDINSCWDGRVINSTGFYPSGTYFYVIKVTERKFALGENSLNKNSYKISGVISLIRD
jgi:gliding motility-associated-like protein